VAVKHKYHLYSLIDLSRKKDGSFRVFKCSLPGCSHYIREDLIENKESLCWSCRGPLILVKDLISPKPVCRDCWVDGELEEAEVLLKGLKEAVGLG
jgi:hypothetical protein